MLAIWFQIAWKEWREHVWKMIAVAAIALSIEGYLIVNYPAEGGQAFLASLSLVPGAVFIAMGVAAGERTAGSLDFLRSLPIGLWKWAVARLLAGAVAVLMPLSFVVLLQLIAGRPARGDVPDLGQGITIVGLICLSVYLWTVAVGVERSSELRAGVAAVCLFVGWLALAMAVFSLGVFFLPSLRPVYGIVVVLSPVGAVRLGDARAGLGVWQVALLQVLTLAGLTWWSVRRYGRLVPSDDRSPAATRPDRLAPAALRPSRRSPLVAMVWKEYREAKPICVAGLVIIGALTLPSLIGLAGELGTQALRQAAGVIAFLGTLMALVLGVGGHAGDLHPGVWQFWRSRPIATAGWFWIKYLTGATVLLATFEGATTAIDLLAGWPGTVVRDPVWWCGPVFHLLAYSLAVWMVCQLRQPIYAGILSLGLLISVAILGDYPFPKPYLPWLSFNNVIRLAPEPDDSFPVFLGWLTDTYLPFAATMIGLSLFFTLLGWAAVRRVEAR